MHDDDVIGWETDPDASYERWREVDYTITPEGIFVGRWPYQTKIQDVDAFFRRQGMRPVTRGEQIARLRQQLAELEGGE
jgi:hypothetical protein